MRWLFFILIASFSLITISGYTKDKRIKNNGWEAYAELQNGNMRFYEGKAKHPRQSGAQREKLTEGQNPHTIVLSCSDSRVPPEEIFDQGLGDIFSIRLAGNVLSSDAIASIEYAVEHLGTGLLVVMGHESCGAVKAALDTKPGSSAGSKSLDELVAKIRPHVYESFRTDSSGDSHLRAPVKANVQFVAKDLLQRSKIVQEAVAQKRLILAQAIYSLSTGRVEFWNVGAKRYIASTEHSNEEELLADGESSAPVRSAPRILEEKVVTERIVPERMPASVDYGQ